MTLRYETNAKSTKFVSLLAFFISFNQNCYSFAKTPDFLKKIIYDFCDSIQILWFHLDNMILFGYCDFIQILWFYSNTVIAIILEKIKSCSYNLGSGYNIITIGLFYFTYACVCTIYVMIAISKCDQ